MNNENSIENSVVEPVSSADIGTMNANVQKKSNKVLIPIILGIIVILLAVGGGIWYFCFNNNPTSVFKTVLNERYDDFKEALKSYDEFFNSMKNNSDSFKLTGDATVGGTLLNFDKLKDDKIEYGIGLDYANKKFEVSGSLLENNKKLLNGNAYLINNKLYIKSDNLFDSVIEYDQDMNFDDMFDLEDLKNLEMPSSNDIEEITSLLKEAINKSFDKNDITKSNEKVTINKNEVEATKYGYTLNKESAKHFFKAFSNYVVQDKVLLEKLAKLNGTEINDVKQAFERFANDSMYDSITKTGFFNIYTTGITKDAIKYEIIVDDIKIAYSNYKDYRIFEANGNGVNFAIESVKENNVDNVAVKYNNETFATLNVRSFDSNLIDFDYNVDAEQLGLKLSGSFKSTYNKVDDKESNGIFELSINLDSMGQKVDAQFKTNYELKFGSKVADVDVTNAKKELSEADSNKMFSKIGELQSTKFYNYITTLTN